MSETLIKVEGVSKKFCRSLKKSLWYGLQDLGREMTGQRHGGNGELRPDEFWAVKDVSFELKRGECLGLIGRNGAGKTTLLRMLNGLIKPDTGRIEMRGRVGALIALGAGFNPILTGRENIYVNAAVLGLSRKETDDKFDEIVEFAELGEFIDAPVQSYSSGMQVRLGFAVAAVMIQPLVLLLDEVLAVGDIGFRMKCLNAVSRMAEGAAVILVSHSMQEISRVANRLIVMDRCVILYDGKDVAHGINIYLRMLEPQTEGSRILGHGVRLLDVKVNGQDAGKQPIVMSLFGDLFVRLRFIVLEENVRNGSLSLVFYDGQGRNVAECHAIVSGGRPFDTRSGGVESEILIPRFSLVQGCYRVVIHFRETNCSGGVNRELGRMEDAFHIQIIGDCQLLASPVALPSIWKHQPFDPKLLQEFK